MIGGKKGLSTIIATILLVLLSIVAVTVIAGFVVPFVRDNLYEGTECIDYQDYFSFNEDFDYNCYKNEGSHYLYGISISAESTSNEIEANVKGFGLAFLTPSGDSESVEVYNGAPNGSNEGEIRRINASEILEIPQGGGTRTYVYNSSKVFEYVKIFPNLESGKSCPESDSVKILDEICDPSVILSV